MNYNNPNQPGSQFPYQYGQQQQAPPMPPSGGAGYPNLAGVGQQPYGMPQYPPGGATGAPMGGYGQQPPMPSQPGSAYPPQQSYAPPQQQPYYPPPQQPGAYGAPSGYQQPYQQQANQQRYRPNNAP